MALADWAAVEPLDHHVAGEGRQSVMGNVEDANDAQIRAEHADFEDDKFQRTRRGAEELFLL